MASVGTKWTGTRIDFDFDTFYRVLVAPACLATGMKAILSVVLCETMGITKTAFQGTPIILVDFQGDRTSVPLLTEQYGGGG